MQIPGPANPANMTNNSSVSINQKQQALRMQSQRQNTQQTMEPKPSHMHVAGQMQMNSGMPPRGIAQRPGSTG